MSGSSGVGTLQPTYKGFVSDSADGLVLFEGCLAGKLNHVPRRPHDRERTALITSGSVFIYEENATGIKRWTDGVAWSPSRILGNFLIYRELEKPFPPGEKKRAMKRKRSLTRSGEPCTGQNSDEDDTNEYPAPITPEAVLEVKNEFTSGTNEDKEYERQLIGSLVDSYGFKPNGLVKKTMSVAINGVSHHLVSYYTVSDVRNNKLQKPSEDPRLANLQIRQELFEKQNFRAPLDGMERLNYGQAQYHMYPSVANGAYNVRSGQYIAAQGYPQYGQSMTHQYSYPIANPQFSTPQQQSGLLASYGGNSTVATPVAQSFDDVYNRPAITSPTSPHIKTENGLTSQQSHFQSINRGLATSSPEHGQVSHRQSTLSMDGHAHNPFGPSSGSNGMFTGQSQQLHNTTGGLNSAGANGQSQQRTVRSPSQAYSLPIQAHMNLNTNIQSQSPTTRLPQSRAYGGQTNNQVQAQSPAVYRQQPFVVQPTGQEHRTAAEMAALSLRNGTYATPQQSYAGLGGSNWYDAQQHHSLRNAQVPSHNTDEVGSSLRPLPQAASLGSGTAQY
ncbi:hypothetical protein B0A49_02949 [Cryomyces minteri]|uniref:Global transcription regulator sge1 n=1 Tax=Cryomyces minteri TaxID=331657 RepID=A0A4U0XI95_9PEZI|nr:hypothetical protein B0A49_02949 [Cryomyces minteri]